jgi:hypothetical protein
VLPPDRVEDAARSPSRQLEHPDGEIAGVDELHGTIGRARSEHTPAAREAPHDPRYARDAQKHIHLFDGQVVNQDLVNA